MLRGTNSELAGLTGSVTSEKKKKDSEDPVSVKNTDFSEEEPHEPLHMYTDKDAAGARYAKWNSMSEVKLNYSLQ